MKITREELANLIHEYNDACHMNVPNKAVCNRCYGIAGQVLIFMGSVLQTEGIQPHPKRIK